MSIPVLAPRVFAERAKAPVLVVGVDGSAGSARAAVAAARLARGLQAQVMPVAATLGESAGDAAAELARIARRDEALALVVGRRGRSATAAAMLGTVSGTLTASAPVPVVVVPDGVLPRPGGGGVVCGVDGSAHARRAVAAAARFAARLGRRLTLVAAEDATSGGESSAVLADAAEVAAFCADVEIAIHPVVGDAAHQLARVAGDSQADLVAVGPRGRAPWRAAALGSVTSCLMRLAPCPVLVVPPGAAIPA
jgi:nucleotide-binding universal stress UspA family protein